MSSQSSITQALDEVQKRFALSTVGGELRVVNLRQVDDVLSGQSNDGVHLLRMRDAELLIRRHLETLPIPSNPQQVITQFKQSPATRTIDDITFSPKVSSPTKLNLWVPPAPSPVRGDWSALRHFLERVICNESVAVFAYLIQYLAHMVQKPHEKPGVMIVLLGGQGTGKGMFFRLLAAIWQRITLIISDIDQVVGRFNAALERSFVVCLDEALFVGDRKAQDRLKSMITEPVISIEQKFQPSRQVRSLHRLFAASNHEHFAQIDQDDRRMVIIRVSEEYQQDTAYFAGVHAALHDSVTLNAMFYDLINLDISKFDVRHKPANKELANQKIRSLAGFDRYWLEVLISGFLFPGGKSIGGYGGRSEPDRQWNHPMFVSTSAMMSNLRQYDPSVDRYQSIQESTISQRLKVLCPSAIQDRKSEKRCNGDTEIRRGYSLPSLDLARTEFSRHLRCALDWETGESRAGEWPSAKHLVLPSDGPEVTEPPGDQNCHLLPDGMGAKN